MLRLIKLSLVFLLLLILQYKVYGQFYNFKHYNVENGFPQANGDCIIQDHLGYLWIATQVGAVQFDGYEYFVLNKEKGLSNNIVNKLFQAHDKKTWIGTKNGLCVYNYDTVLIAKNEDLATANILNIWEDHANKLWVASESNLYENKNGAVKKKSFPLFRKGIYCAKKNGGQIFLGTNRGVIIQENEKFYEFELNDQIGNYSIRDIAIDKQGSYWLATGKKGLIQISGNTIHILNEENGFISNIVDDLLCDSHNNIWIGTEGKGVIKFDGSSYTHYTDRNGMNNTSVLSLFEDKEQNIWIGGRNGIIMFNPNNPFIHYPSANKSTQESVFGMVEDRKGNFWFTTYGNGISKYDGKDFTYFDESDGIGDNRFFDVIESHQGHLWFASAGHGIVKYDGSNFEVFDKNKGFENARVFQVIEDNQGNIWCCTSGHGIVKYDGSKFEKFTKKDGMPGNTVMSVLQDGKNHLWIGTFGNGLGKYENGKFIDYNKTYKIPVKSVRGITSDNQGKLWFGTAAFGVFTIEKLLHDSAVCRYINKNDGLSSNNVYTLIVDRNRQLWVGTEKGIDKVVLDAQGNIVHIDNYSKAEGFIGVETSINGSMEDSQGNLWFASLIGVSKYIPGIEKKNTEPPATHITGIDLFYKETAWEQYSDSLGFRGMPATLKLPHNKNHLTFQYTGICLTNPAKVRYKFKLEGLDEHWSPVTSKREAVYANIPPGDYVFKVMAMNNDGVWNTKPTKFAFSVQPPFWQTPVFIIATAFFLVLLVFIYIRLRIRNLRKAKHRLAYRVQERTKELLIQKKEIEEKNEELGQVNEELNAQKAEIIAQRDLVETQKNTLERTYKQVTDSILYAEKIQRAVMPKEEYLNKLFPEHFVFYKPLHIVSGDFYWAIKKEHMLLFAVADCTGHGVPGGFMSMLGVALITDIVNKPYVNHPDIALNQLRESIIRSLRQKGVTGEQKDGMDIALCALDTETMELEYAGANNPIYLSTNLDSAKKIHSDYPNKIRIHYYNACTLVEIMPDKMPIAIFENMNNFSRITLQLHQGDMLYLFSDGYLDQFGGPKSRKFTRDSFKELIASVVNKTANKQLHTIEGTFFEWKGTHKQVDDILIMGIRI